MRARREVAAEIDEHPIDTLHRARGGQLRADAARAGVAAREVEAAKRGVDRRAGGAHLVGRLPCRDRGAELLSDPLLDEVDREPIDEERVLVEAGDDAADCAEHRLLPGRPGVFQRDVARRRHRADGEELVAGWGERRVEVRRNRAVERDDRRDLAARHRCEHLLQVARRDAEEVDLFPDSADDCPRLDERRREARSSPGPRCTNRGSPSPDRRTPPGSAPGRRDEGPSCAGSTSRRRCSRGARVPSVELDAADAPFTDARCASRPTPVRTSAPRSVARRTYVEGIAIDPPRG